MYPTENASNNDKGGCVGACLCVEVCAVGGVAKVRVTGKGARRCRERILQTLVYMVLCII